MRKPAFCICENKDADQLCGNPEAVQRLCFRYTDSTIPLLPKSEISSLQLSSWLYSPVCVGPGRKPRRPVFSQRGSIGNFHFPDTEPHQQAVECLMVMIYSPYIPYLVKYKSYEEALLLKELNNIKLVSLRYELCHEKTSLCICDNKSADQLRDNHAADQCLCFSCISLFFLNPKFQVSNYLLWLNSPVGVGPGQKPRRQILA